jgi:hypothetical protein
MRWILAAVATVAALPLAAQADSRVRYTYAELGYVNVDVDQADIDGDGFALRGSYALPNSLFLYGEFLDADLDFDTDFTNIEVGLGGHLTIERGIDLVGRVGIDNLEIGRDDEDGLALAVGLRGKASGNLEFEGLVRYVDLGSDNDDTSLRGEGRYFFSPNGSVGVQLELGDELTTFGVFGRWTF